MNLVNITFTVNIQLKSILTLGDTPATVANSEAHIVASFLVIKIDRNI